MGIEGFVSDDMTQVLLRNGHWIEVPVAIFHMDVVIEQEYFFEGKIKAMAVGFDSGFFAGPEGIEGQERLLGFHDAEPFVIAHDIAEVLEVDGAHIFDIGADTAIGIEHTDDLIAGVGDIEIEGQGQRWPIEGIDGQIRQPLSRLVAKLAEPSGQEEFAEQSFFPVFCPFIAEDGFLQGGRQGSQQKIKAMGMDAILSGAAQRKKHSTNIETIALTLKKNEG